MQFVHVMRRRKREAFHYNFEELINFEFFFLLFFLLKVHFIYIILDLFSGIIDTLLHSSAVDHGFRSW